MKKDTKIFLLTLYSLAITIVLLNTPAQTPPSENEQLKEFAQEKQSLDDYKGKLNAYREQLAVSYNQFKARENLFNKLKTEGVESERDWAIYKEAMGCGKNAREYTHKNLYRGAFFF